MADGTLTFEDVLMEAGFIPKWLEEGREAGREAGKEEAAKNLLRLGWDVEKTAEVSELKKDKSAARFPGKGLKAEGFA